MVVFMGGHASGFKNVHDHDTYDADGTRLFHVRGTCEADTRAVQVPEQAAYLSPDDVFVLETPGATYIWNGQVRGARGGGRGCGMKGLCGGREGRRAENHRVRPGSVRGASTEEQALDLKVAPCVRWKMLFRFLPAGVISSLGVCLTIL